MCVFRTGRGYPFSGNYPPRSSKDKMSQGEEWNEPWPTIRFYCVCGKFLYRISTNIGEFWGQFICPKCEREYVSRNGMIATPRVYFAKDGTPSRIKPLKGAASRSSRNRRLAGGNDTLPRPGRYLRWGAGLK